MKCFGGPTIPGLAYNAMIHHEYQFQFSRMLFGAQGEIQ